MLITGYNRKVYTDPTRDPSELTEIVVDRDKGITRPVVAYIAGLADVTIEQFVEHYVPKIEKAIKLGHHFVLHYSNPAYCPAYAMLLRVFAQEPERFCLYSMANEPYFKNSFRHKRGYRLGKDREIALSADSDYDIAWYTRVARGYTPQKQAIAVGAVTRRVIYRTEVKNYRGVDPTTDPDTALDRMMMVLQMEQGRRFRGEQAVIRHNSTLNPSVIFDSRNKDLI